LTAESTRQIEKRAAEKEKKKEAELAQA